MFKNRKMLNGRSKQREAQKQGKRYMTPYYEGDEARVFDEPATANPYKENTEDHTQWLKGWMEANV